ncbi:hypothetical protein ANN_24356 [Periplaneta americana]|uniref:Uncharacterized protein n=1 Tax=Periplaneta americana TaxID=6978 RepID=A0ABQ8S2X0_PERAM|nr:hypothetical protein ANN_24356 [Periplaneta americana]
MAGLCEGGNEPPGSLKASIRPNGLLRSPSIFSGGVPKIGFHMVYSGDLGVWNSPSYTPERVSRLDAGKDVGLFYSQPAPALSTRVLEYCPQNLTGQLKERRAEVERKLLAVVRKERGGRSTRRLRMEPHKYTSRQQSAIHSPQSYCPLTAAKARYLHFAFLGCVLVYRAQSMTSVAKLAKSGTTSNTSHVSNLPITTVSFLAHRLLRQRKDTLS